MKDWISLFIDEIKTQKNISDNTVISYKGDIGQFLAFLEAEKIEITDINSKVVQSYVKYLSDLELSVATQYRKIASLRGFILFLSSELPLNRNLVKELKLPKLPKKNKEILSVEQISELIEMPDRITPKGLRDRAILELLYATGIQVSELIALKRSDINLELGYLKCTGNHHRVIPLTYNVIVILEDYLLQSRDYFIKENDDYLFYNMQGKSITRQGIWKILKAYGDRLDVEVEITPHLLRHSFAAHLLQNGASIYAVQELLGHMDINSTQTYLPQEEIKIKDELMHFHPRG